MPLRFKCGSCRKSMTSFFAQPGEEVVCHSCGATVRVPDGTESSGSLAGAVVKESSVVPAGLPDETTEAPDTTTEEKESEGSYGWLWFLLVFGVGNLILYSTTGMLLIPIPRK